MLSVSCGRFEIPSWSNLTEIKILSPIYELACAIFRVVAMALQYATVAFYVTFKHLPLFPSALPSENLIAVSRNISNLAVLRTCLTTAWSPEPQTHYQNLGLGEEKGLRITHDIILRPASGICLGKSMTFLSEYRLATGKGMLANLRSAAKKVEGESNEISIRMQALYDALMGINGKASTTEKDHFFQILEGKKPSSETHYPFLATSLEAFLEEASDQGLRHFVLEDLEKQDVIITTPLYSLILELDTIWSLQQDSGMRKNDTVHQAIVETVAESLNLNLIDAKRMQGNVSSMCRQIEKLEPGTYLMQFSNHTIACVKEDEAFALFDPNEGLAIFDESNLHDGLQQLLHFYGCHLNLIELQ